MEEVSRESSHYILSIPSGNAGNYRLSQLDDYAKTNRNEFPHRYPVTLSLSARVSSESIPGTWGFGLWNDPFGLSLGFGGNSFRLPALPNAVWFFGASEESYLSFQNTSRAERRVDEAQLSPTNRASSTSGATYDQREQYIANGFLAQTFRSPKFHPWLIPAGMALPLSRKMTRWLLGKVIADEGINLRRGGQPPFGDASRLPAPTKVTDWHRYRLDWREMRVSFEVDDSQVFESLVSPHPPLGLVIWIDNQFAAFTPEGRIGFGLLENPEPAWLEVKDVEVK